MIDAEFGQFRPEEQFPTAVYARQAIREHRGNKFIEALPPLVDEETLARFMWKHVDIEPSDLEEPAFVRLHMVAGIAGSFMQPLTDHVLLATEISKIMRAGYLTRNPSSPDFLSSMGVRVNALNQGISVARSGISGNGMALIGMSGVGKSTAIDTAFRYYPPVIWHPELTGPLRSTLQVTSIKITCPLDCSISEVCRAFFLQLDRLLHTQYHAIYCNRGTVATMREGMARLAFLHGVGVLVIDEVQNLATAKYARENVLLKFFLLLRDELKVPVIAVGTDEAISVLGNTMKHARRHAGQPLFSRMKNDGEFRLFCDAMFRANYLREKFVPNKEFRDQLYLLSQGIADVVIKLWELSQSHALTNGLEHIDTKTLQTVYQSHLHLLHVHLENLRNGGEMHSALWEVALRATRSSIPPIELDTPSVKNSRQTKVTKASFSRAPQKNSNDRKKNVPQLLSIVEAKSANTDAHEALRKSGKIRDLGFEVTGKKVK